MYVCVFIYTQTHLYISLSLSLSRGTQTLIWVKNTGNCGKRALQRDLYPAKATNICKELTNHIHAIITYIVIGLQSARAPKKLKLTLRYYSMLYFTLCYFIWFSFTVLYFTLLNFALLYINLLYPIVFEYLTCNLWWILYGVVTISRLLKILGPFCIISSLL